MTEKKIRTIDLAYIALFAALIAMCSWVTIPAAVPFTLQTFGIFAALFILGGRRGTIAIAVYILLGVIGMPVFHGFRGGVGVLLGNTGGYIMGFLASGLIYWAVAGKPGCPTWRRAAAAGIGLLVCYIFGTVWFMAVYTGNTGSVALMTVLGWCVLPFIIPDIIKIALALLLSKKMTRFLK